MRKFPLPLKRAANFAAPLLPTGPVMGTDVAPAALEPVSAATPVDAAPEDANAVPDDAPLVAFSPLPPQPNSATAPKMGAATRLVLLTMDECTTKMRAWRLLRRSLRGENRKRPSRDSQRSAAFRLSKVRRRPSRMPTVGS